LFLCSAFDEVFRLRIDGNLSGGVDKPVGFDRLSVGADGFGRFVSAYGFSLHISLLLWARCFDGTAAWQGSANLPVGFRFLLRAQIEPAYDGGQIKGIKSAL
jgi:hypothetical protein